RHAAVSNCIYVPSVTDTDKLSVDSSNDREATRQQYSISMEKHCRHFRQFCYQEAEGPQEVYSRLCELSHLWLQPGLHTKEQIIKLLVLEQFLTISPEGIQTWAQRFHPETGNEVVALVEDFQLIHQEIGKCGHGEVKPNLLSGNVIAG
uniref:SCAN box domain-containing protein n=1 Tax=Gopherus agassizii TaxID=38772 RepID=A0A452GJS0_9SAUR